MRVLSKRFAFRLSLQPILLPLLLVSLKLVAAHEVNGLMGVLNGRVNMLQLIENWLERLKLWS